jgi:hypothetical protein
MSSMSQSAHSTRWVDFRHAGSCQRTTASNLEEQLPDLFAPLSSP